MESIKKLDNSESLKQICLQVTRIVRDVGNFQRKEFHQFDTDAIEQKASNDLVSYVDKTSEQLLVDALSQLLPEAGFETEESITNQTLQGLRWIIDPLDGTTNFIHKVPLYTISVALKSETNELLIGVVFDPSSNECFYAWKDGGAYLNGENIEVSTVSSLNKSLLATGFPYDLLGKADAYFELLKQCVLKTHGLRRLGSAALDLCYVASGRVECYFEFNLHSYDVAAGILIVREAKGFATNFNGNHPECEDGSEICASNNFIHDEMLKLIQTHMIS
jgi:myo-inositol-1(or 4)-monophosphatase